MDGVLKIAAEQAPALVVLVFLVIYFTRSVRSAITQFLNFIDRKDAKIEAMTDKMAESIERNTDKMNLTIKENTDKMNRVVEQNTEVLTHVKLVLAQKKTGKENP